MAAERKVTREELDKHNKEGDCWIVVHGKVYDVSAFMDDHPGGGGVLLDTHGTDATDEFEDIGHTEKARTQMDSMLVGVFDGELGGGSSSKTGGSGGAGSSGSSSMVVPILVILLAVAFFMFKDQLLGDAQQ